MMVLINELSTIFTTLINLIRSAECSTVKLTILFVIFILR